MSQSTLDMSEDISNEDIKHLVFRTEPEEIKYPMYRSKFCQQVRQEYKKGRALHQTMGYADGNQIEGPNQFLKKRSRQLYIASVDKPEKKEGSKLAQVPKREEWNQLPQRVERNHLINNIRKVVKSVPPTGPSRAVDSRTGERMHNCNLLIPKYCTSEKFGKVPNYIQKIKKQLKEGNPSVRTLSQKGSEKQDDESIEPGVRVLSEEERDSILKNLKSVWADLQREFQILPVLNDTPPKVKRKEALEAKLIEVEKDIKLIEENERIYVVDDPTDPRCAKPNEPDPCYTHINYMKRKTIL